MKLTEVTDFGGDNKRVRFHCVYDATIPEDVRFQKATPTGSLELYIDNKAVTAGIKIGTCYYLDFTETQ